MVGVDMWVDFINIQLSRNNWHDFLRDENFPPDLSQYYPDDSTDDDPTSTLRFHGISFLGRGEVHIHSRPLQRKLGSVSLDFSVAEDLNRIIAEKSELNLKSTGRRGCTADEIVVIVQSYAKVKLQQFILRFLEDLATQPDDTVSKAEKLINLAGDSLKIYAKEAGRHTGDHAQRAIMAKMDELRSGEKLSKWTSLLQNAVQAVDDHIGSKKGKPEDESTGHSEDL